MIRKDPKALSLIAMSIGAAVCTVVLKFGAYALTDSVAFLSDAAESSINLVAAITAYVALKISHRPADHDHTYGHQKVEYFSSGTEGFLILLAAIAIAWTAINRLMHPVPLEQLGAGLIVTAVATAINLVVGLMLLRYGRKHENIVLEADGHHLLTDVWTSVGVVFGVAMVLVTKWTVLDSLVAIGVAINIVWTAVHLIRRSVDGLMDRSLPVKEIHTIQQAIEKVLREQSTVEGVELKYHGLRTRQSGSRRFADFHLLTPGSWTVDRGHQQAVLVEKAIQELFPHIEVLIHIEPLEDQGAYNDTWEHHG